MTRILPQLHEGHAPIHLHIAFSDALEAYLSWDKETAEPRIPIDGAEVPISSVFGRMRTCTDLLPVRVLDDVEEITSADLQSEARPASYADAARIMRGLCVQHIVSRKRELC